MAPRRYVTTAPTRSSRVDAAEYYATNALVDRLEIRALADTAEAFRSTIARRVFPTVCPNCAHATTCHAWSSADRGMVLRWVCNVYRINEPDGAAIDCECEGEANIAVRWTRVGGLPSEND